MKPLFDRMVDMIVAGLSGKARGFYELEFEFFGEITSISGKLKPYIKKSKPEKKVCHTLLMNDGFGVKTGMLSSIRPRLTRKWPKSSSPWASTCRRTLMAW